MKCHFEGILSSYSIVVGNLMCPNLQANFQMSKYVACSNKMPRLNLSPAESLDG